MPIDITIVWTTGHQTAFQVWGKPWEAAVRILEEVRREAGLLYAGRVRHPLSISAVWKDDAGVEHSEVLTGIGLLEAALTVPEDER